MNHLAHFFLSCQSEDLMIGNFIADYIKNKDVESYTIPVQQGIQLHRQIDSFTDTHPIVKQGTKRLQSHHRKYAPVVLDVLYDYLLVKNWQLYSGRTLEEFTQEVYRTLERRVNELPPRLQKSISTMIAHDWLRAYGTYEGLKFTLQKMDERTSFPSNLAAAVEHLQADEALFSAEFNQFFPDLIKHVEEVCNC